MHQIALELQPAGPLDRVANGPHDHRTIDLILDQIVLCPVPNGPQTHFLYIETRQHDDGRVKRRLVQMLERFQARAVGQPEVEQHDVGIPRVQGREGIGQACDAPQLYRDIVALLDVRLDQTGIARIVLDQQQFDRLIFHVLHGSRTPPPPPLLLLAPGRRRQVVVELEELVEP
jgi:hypothetical protein